MSVVDLSKDPIRPGAPAPKPPRPGPRIRPLVVAVLLALFGLGGIMTAMALDAPGFGPGWLRGPFAGHFGAPRFDPAAVEDRVDRGIRHLAIEIDATPEQQEKLRVIARGLVKDLLPLRDARAEMASRARTMLTAATVDKAEVEKFRAEQVARLDATSKRIAKAIDDVSDVLSLEQRRKIAERLPPAGAGPFGFSR